MKNTIFHTEIEMPPKSNSPDVVRTALTPAELIITDHALALSPQNHGVKSVERPRRGHGY